MISLRVLGMALALGMIPAVAANAAAQNQRPIRARDVPAAQAADVYQLVEKLRPDWLGLGGDAADPASRAKVRVWVGETHAGGLEALRGLTTTNLSSVRLVGPEVARARDPRLDPAVVGAVLVRYEEAAAAPRRMELSFGIGRRGELEGRAEQSMLDAGFDTSNRVWEENVDHPMAFYATGKLRLRHRAGVSLNALHTGGHNVRGMPQTPPFVGVSSRFSTTDLAAQAFIEPSRFRLGVGPALRMLSYRQTTGGCECNDAEDGSDVVLGGAADLGIASPAFGPMQLELVLAARWFPSHAVPAYHGAPELELGGFTSYLTLGAGFGF
jgi:hypothetical protein